MKSDRFSCFSPPPSTVLIQTAKRHSRANSAWTITSLYNGKSKNQPAVCFHRYIHMYYMYVGMCVCVFRDKTMDRRNNLFRRIFASLENIVRGFFSCFYMPEWVIWYFRKLPASPIVLTMWCLYDRIQI